jgi:hypothetical protein
VEEFAMTPNNDVEEFATAGIKKVPWKRFEAQTPALKNGAGVGF